MTLDEFIEMVCQRPIPQNPMARVKTMAKELAEGDIKEIWLANFDAELVHVKDRSRLVVKENPMYKFIYRRWGDVKSYPPDLILLERMGYLTIEFSGEFDYYDKNYRCTLTNQSYLLIEDVEPSTIFISYKRSESSVFSLLVLKSLKQNGLEPFLDMTLEPGEDWHDGLKDRIQSRDYFILLLGNTTLHSPHVIKEINWALGKDITIIPIWQPEFEFRADDWPDLPDPIKHKLTHTHRIKVQDENPLEYEKALIELLNRFGITP